MTDGLERSGQSYLAAIPDRSLVAGSEADVARRVAPARGGAVAADPIRSTTGHMAAHAEPSGATSVIIRIGNQVTAGRDLSLR